MFDFVSVPGYLSCTICSVLNLCIVLWHLAKKYRSCVFSPGRLQTGAFQTCIQLKGTHWLQLKPISSCAAPERWRNAHKSHNLSQNSHVWHADGIIAVPGDAKQSGALPWSTQMSAPMLGWRPESCSDLTSISSRDRSLGACSHTPAVSLPTPRQGCDLLNWSEFGPLSEAFFQRQRWSSRKKKKKEREGDPTVFIQRECWTSDRKSTVVTCMLSLSGTQNSEQETPPLFTEGLGGEKKGKSMAV